MQLLEPCTVQVPMRSAVRRASPRSTPTHPSYRVPPKVLKITGVTHRNPPPIKHPIMSKAQRTLIKTSSAAWTLSTMKLLGTSLEAMTLLLTSMPANYSALLQEPRMKAMCLLPTPCLQASVPPSREHEVLKVVLRVPSMKIRSLAATSAISVAIPTA